MAAADRETATVQAQVDAELKAKAEVVLARLGFSPSDAIERFYREVVRHDDLPFEWRIPNAETIEAIKEGRAGRGMRFPDARAMFEEAGITVPAKEGKS